MPFGLTNAPAVFQQMRQNCNGFNEDICVYSKNAREHLAMVTEKLWGYISPYSQVNLCCFSRRDLKLLGYILSGEERIRSGRKKVKAIISLQCKGGMILPQNDRF